VSARVAGLAEGVMKTMLLTKFKGLCAMLVVGVALGFGATGVVTGFSGAASTRAQTQPAMPPAAPERGPGQESGAGKPTALIRGQDLRDADKVDDPFRKVRSMALIARVQHQLGDRASCRKTLGKAIQVADGMSLEDAQDVHQKFHALQEIAWSQSVTGDWAD